MQSRQQVQLYCSAQSTPFMISKHGTVRSHNALHVLVVVDTTNCRGKRGFAFKGECPLVANILKLAIVLELPLPPHKAATVI